MNNQYSPSEFIKNIYSYVCTKITMPQARFIRRPIYIRGRKLICGCNGLTTGRFCRFDLAGKRPTLYVGDNCAMGDMTHIVAHEKVEIGSNVLMASKCFISDTSHGAYSGDDQDSPEIAPDQRKLVTKPVKIGDNVWIGENAVILAGANIGNGCIIGANSIISSDVPDNCIVVGTGVIIKRFSKEENKWIRKA